MSIFKIIRRSALLAAVFLCLTLGAGCSNNPYPPPLQENGADGSLWKVRYGALPEDPRSLDPQVCYDNVGKRVIEPVQ